MLLSSQKSNLDKISKDFGIKTLYRYKRKEIEIVDELKIFFDQINTKINTQKRFGSYHVDLYVPDYEIIIEIDEHNHADRDKKYEKQREKYIKKYKNPKFIRCNPDDPNFNINQLTGKITKHIIKVTNQA